MTTFSSSDFKFPGSSETQSSGTTNTVNLLSTQPQPGMETLEEIKDKDMFFSQMEKQNENGEQIDYGELNREIDNEAYL